MGILVLYNSHLHKYFIRYLRFIIFQEANEIYKMPGSLKQFRYFGSYFILKISSNYVLTVWPVCIICTLKILIF